MVDGGDAEEGEGEAEGAGGGGAEGGTRGDERRRLGLGDRARLVELVEALPAGGGFVKIKYIYQLIYLYQYTYISKEFVKRRADIVGLKRDSKCVGGHASYGWLSRRRRRKKLIE